MNHEEQINGLLDLVNEKKKLIKDLEFCVSVLNMAVEAAKIGNIEAAETFQQKAKEAFEAGESGNYNRD